MVTNGMILLSIPVFWQETTRGGILLAAVTIDHLVTSRKK
jgi:ABC-type xylose transport system permease subunit